MTRALLALAVAGCASAPGAKPAPTPAGEGIPLAGARCAGGACTCRPLDGSADGEEAPPPAGLKRFELRTGRGLDPATVSIDGRPALTKRLDLPDQTCAYIDLPPGKHKVTLRAQAREPVMGMSPALVIAEYGPAVRKWYATFEFACGVSEPCVKEELAELLARERATPRGLHDPCGSTRIERPAWATERSPGARLEDLELQLTLNVYAFATRLPPGSAECVKHRD